MTTSGGWIPVAERLPEDDEFKLVSCKTKAGVRSVNRAYYSRGFWHGQGSMSGVEAWMPLPEPYDGGCTAKPVPTGGPAQGSPAKGAAPREAANPVLVARDARQGTGDSFQEA